MSRTLPAGEPEFGPWRHVPVAHLIDRVRAAAGGVFTRDYVRAGGNVLAGRPLVVAIDGRGAAGKSTLASTLHEHVAASAVVHTDDLAWHEPLFAWGDLLRDHVLRPLRDGRSVSLRPPQWDVHDRGGAIVAPAGLDLVIVEGVGASHRAHAHLLDATVWVQSDFALAERRGIARDIADGINGEPDEATAFWHHWMSAELAFVARQRPWERACAIVDGTPTEPAAPGYVVLAD